MHVILIVIGMHTKPCIASLAFTAFNWEWHCNTDLILLHIATYFSTHLVAILKSYHWFV